MTPLQQLRQLCNYAPLPHAEELVLVKRAKEGDVAARNALALRCMGIIVSQMYRYARTGVPWRVCEELISEGYLGIDRALEKFDPDRGFRFYTYARHWILAFLSRHLQQEIRTSADISLDAELPGVEDETRLMRLADEGTSPDEEAHRKRTDAAVRHRTGLLMRKLGDVDRDILENRLLESNDTLLTISLRHGISRERVRQIESKIKQMLKPRLQDIAAEEEAA